MEDVHKFIFSRNTMILVIEEVKGEHELSPEALRERIGLISNLAKPFSRKGRGMTPRGSGWAHIGTSRVLQIIRTEIQPLDQVARRALLLNINRQILFAPLVKKYEK